MPVDYLSYSSVSAYLACPKSWWFRYIKKPLTKTSVALVFGSAVHDTIETYVSARQQEGVENVRPMAELWPRFWQEQLETRNNIKWDRPMDYYTELGEKMLSVPAIVKTLDGLKLKIENDSPVIEKKVRFNVPGVPIPIIGYIDAIEQDGVPIDIKTAGRAWSRGKEHSELQPTFYLLALNQAGYEIPEWKFRYYVLTKTKAPKLQVLETSRTVDELFWTMGLIAEVWQAIEAGHYHPNPTGWKCNPKYCDYYEFCRG